MRFAAIGDIHSNIAALEAVLADIETQDVDFVISTGDLVGYAPFPNEVIDLLRRKGVISIQGNYDKAVGNRELVCGCDYREEKQLEMAGLSMLFTNTAVTDSSRQYLRTLPQSLAFDVGDLQVLAVHGSPRLINEYLFEDSSAVREVTSTLDADVLICGHTHKPYHKVINGKHVINSGSVGKPKHGNPQATYCLVVIADRKVTVDIREVPYDYELVAAAIETDEVLPDEFAAMLRQGK
jgi:putative phosphoesterase